MLKRGRLVSLSLHLTAQLSCVGLSTLLGVARESPAASELCTYFRLGNPVGKEMRIYLLIVPTKFQSPDWSGFETMAIPTAVL